MRGPFAYGVGGVLSADIAVPNHDMELEFYSKILTTGDAPFWREDLTNNFGAPIIGLGVRTAEHQSLPLQWMPHFQVADVASSVACALELGGKELMHDDQSRWAVLADQAGAAFGVIPVVPAESQAAENSSRVGCISGLTLPVSEVSTSQNFYQQVVGWRAESRETKGGDSGSVSFEMQRCDGIAAAEICHNSGGFQGVPSVWLMHLPVDDLAESLRLVHEGGGEVIMEHAQAHYAIIKDPVGVFIALQAGCGGVR